MPDSMYDKLGELLSEALESGNFFARSQEKHSDNKTEENKDIFDTKNVKDFLHSTKANKNTGAQQNQQSIKYASLKLQKACAFIGITEGMSYEEARRIFRKKLLRFHPDMNADNEVMRKITKQKTLELLTAWNLIEEWYRQ